LIFAETNDLVGVYRISITGKDNDSESAGYTQSISDTFLLTILPKNYAPEFELSNLPELTCLILTLCTFEFPSYFDDNPNDSLITSASLECSP